MSTSSDLIQHLLDGELDQTLETGLFAELASSADLRNELKQQLAIRNTVQQDRMVLVPPAALTNSVFTGLGFAAPLAGAAAGAAGGGLLAAWLTKLGVPFLSAVAAAGMTWLVTQQSTDATIASTPVTGATEQAAITAAPLAQPAAPAQTMDDAERIHAQRELRQLRNENGLLRRALAEAELNTTPVQNIESNSMPTPPAMEQQMPAPAVSSLLLTSDLRLTRDDGRKPFGMSPLVETRSAWQRYPAFLLQARGFSTTSLTDVSVMPESAWYDNVSLSFLYQLGDHHGVGMEFGNETFAQVFEGDRNGQRIRYEQEPSAMWAGVFYRYQTAPIANNFIPFGQALVGGTKFGPLGRATVGIQYAPAGPLSFLLGVEGTLMAYQFQNAWFTSSKLGLTYGVAVRF